MTQIIDDARVMLLFDAVIGSGNNAEYTVNGYTGVAVMNVLMSGNPKYIWVQPARVQDPTGVGDEDGIIDDETTVFAPLILIE
jgi:hypothetical protein